MNPEKARIVIAMAMYRHVVVLATDSMWVEREADVISVYTDDLGILEAKDYDVDPGLYLWEGTLKEVWSGPPGEETPETEYEGTLRRILPSEMEELLAMAPPPPPEFVEDGPDDTDKFGY